MLAKNNRKGYLVAPGNCGRRTLPIRDEVLNWLEEARADLKHAHDCIELGRFNWACFASQQAAEKSPQGRDTTYQRRIRPRARFS